MTQMQKPSASMPTPACNPAKPHADNFQNDTGPESDAVREIRKRAAGEIAQAMKKTFLDSVKPAEGVVLMTLTEPSLQTVAAAAAVHSILAHQTIADIPVHAVSEITFLHSFGSREAESVTSYMRTDNHVNKVPNVAIEHCSRFNPFAPEGVSLLMKHVRTEACVFALVAYRDLKRDDAIAAITRLNAEALAVHALIVILLVHTKKQDVTEFCKCCSASVEVSSCEPGPGAQTSVLLDNVTLTSWHQQGIGRVMVEASLKSDGTWTFTSEPFIAKRSIILLAWYVLCRANLRREEVPLAKLAQVVGIDPSNISRGIALLLISPKNTVGVAPPKGWLARWAADYSLEIIWARKSTDEKAVAPAAPDSTGQTATGALARVCGSLNGPQ